MPKVGNTTGRRATLKAGNRQRHAATNRGFKKGVGALRAGSAFRKSNASTRVDRTAPNAGKEGPQSHYRTKGTINRLNMYKKRITMAELERRKIQPKAPVRIHPDRRWFGNTRVITQSKMSSFREELGKSVNDPFQVVLKQSKLPMSLLQDTEKTSRMNLLSIEPFGETFGKKKQRKRVKLNHYDLEGMMQRNEEQAEKYETKGDSQLKFDLETGEEKGLEGKVGWFEERVFDKGTSARIWRELWKVVDCSDVLVMVIDARDPMGTRNMYLEREICKNHPNKHIVLLYNKCDLVPTWVTRRWVAALGKEYPTLAFHASISNPFGKNSLLQLLRQFGTLMKDRKHVSVGLIGYPNVGKSSVINTLRKKKVCKAAPVPGETKVWQYITLTKKIYAIDCPGIVPMTKKDFAADSGKVLKGVVRAEKIENPSNYIDEVLSRVKRHYLLQRYKLPEDSEWADAEEFLTLLATKMGKMFKGGIPDIETAARSVLYDWQRGRLPFFAPPPEEDGEKQPSSSSASSKPVNPQPVADEESAEEEQGTKPAEGRPDTPTVVQGFSDLKCSVSYDDEDRRDDEPVPAAEAGDGGENTKKRRREGGDAPEKKKKKARRGGGGEKARKAAIALNASTKPGAPDWAAFTSEFDS